MNIVWQYRFFMLGAIRREFLARYQRSSLGALWALLGPMAMIVVYSLVFSHFMRSRLPLVDTPYAYSIHLCAGIIFWTYLSDSISRCSVMFIEHANLIKKMPFPRICLLFITLGSTTLNTLITCGLFFVYLLLVDHLPSTTWPAIIVLVVLQAVFLGVLGLTLGILNVFFRDIGPLVGIGMQFWFWLTPIVYPLSILPTWLSPWIELNPATPLVTAYQTIFLHDRLPDWGTLWPLGVIVLLCGLLSVLLYKYRMNDLVDEL